MVSGGKHLKKQANKKRGSGAHLSERDRQRGGPAALTQRKPTRQTQARRTADDSHAAALHRHDISAAQLHYKRLGLCRYAAARETALADAGITQEKANDLSAEMIKIGDTVCYKVQFTGSVTDYRYIIDAKTGLIIGQNFYRTEG